MKLRATILVVTVAVVFPAVAQAGKVVPRGQASRRPARRRSRSRCARPAAFKVLLRTSTQGRTKLFLLGKHAPKGGALIDTKTYACDGAAGSFYCKGSYEPLPAGTYTFRVVYAGTTSQPANIELTVRW